MSRILGQPRVVNERSAADEKIDSSGAGLLCRFNGCTPLQGVSSDDVWIEEV